MRRSLLVLLAGVLIASVVASAVGICGTTYTWEKTFDVKKPEIECEIEVGDKRIVGCPVYVWVSLNLEDGWKDSCWNNWKDNCDDDDCKSCSKNWKGNHDDDYEDLWECGCYVNGTYSAHLYWYNGTSAEWQHVKHLQEETNITLTCYKHTWTYTFVPMWEGSYKVVVMFAMDSEVCTFTNED
ncbi:MAG: hypothetical protein OEX76_02410 [Candidatus Bathyarchaeota archaeon]|nr:hypothetical protein [Candidatus Bathyarchaeota archaeon]MDH5713473.1 hypothetical protein [Candidatus Bathyarchaeota archaeon]